MRCHLLPLLSLCGLLSVLGPARAADAGAPDEQALKKLGLGTDGEALLEFFRKRLVNDADLAKVEALVKKLGDEAFEVREQASDELIRLGPVAEGPLRLATKSSDPEVRKRAEDCLQKLSRGSTPATIAAAARLLGLRKPDAAAPVLLAYLPAAADPYLVDEIQAVLAQVAVRDGKKDRVLVEALDDKVPARRAAAAVALCRAGAAELRDAFRKLLKDHEAGVRLPVALALLAAKDKEAVPVLIDLLAELPREQGWQAEDALCRLAGEQAPKAWLDKDAASRKKCRDAWAGWWADQGKIIDLAKIDLANRLLGYTVIVQRDKTNTTTGKVMELDAAGKLRWEIKNLQTPVDAQVLPGDRVLVSEYTPKRVSERNLKGDVLWEKKVTGYLVGAQRLPNGNTFIACRNQLMEVDRDGKEVFSVTRSANDVYAAQRLRNGHIGLVTSAGNFVLLDAGGKEVKTFPVGRIQLYGGVEVLPSGGVLVALYSANKVVEYDAEGKVAWEATFTQPTSVVRLPSGNVLVASNAGGKVVELDRNGKEVWSHTSDGRPYRAWRR